MRITTMSGIKLTFENEEFVIQATPEGLKRFIGICENLLDNPRQGHIHLEDYELLNPGSHPVTLVLTKDSK